VTTFVHAEFHGRQLEPAVDHSSCGGRSVADKVGALVVRDGTRRVVRRRILEAQLSRLLRRMEDGPATADVAGRAARLIARLDRDDLDW
jgi:hypothetical protein